MKVFIGILISPNKPLAKLVRCIRSIEGQVRKPFTFDIKVIVNEPLGSIFDYDVRRRLQQEELDCEVIRTEGIGLAARGHNSVLDEFLSRKEYTHIMKIDYDDFYYPFAFQMIDLLLKKREVDFLNLCHLGDNLVYYKPSPDSPGTIEEFAEKQNLPVIEIVPGVALRSPFELRIDSEDLNPIFKMPYYYWDGISCPGGEITLIKSRKAVETMTEKGYRYLEIPNVSDDYTYMMYALLEHLRENIVFANTDCNEIYCYDMTGQSSTTRGSENEFTLDASRWAKDAKAAIANPEFEELRGIARQHFPFVQIQEQICNRKIKQEFLKKNWIE